MLLFPALYHHEFAKIVQSRSSPVFPASENNKASSSTSLSSSSPSEAVEDDGGGRKREEEEGERERGVGSLSSWDGRRRKSETVPDGPGTTTTAAAQSAKVPKAAARAKVEERVTVVTPSSYPNAVRAGEDDDIRVVRKGVSHSVSVISVKYSSSSSSHDGGAPKGERESADEEVSLPNRSLVQGGEEVAAADDEEEDDEDDAFSAPDPAPNGIPSTSTSSFIRSESGKRGRRKGEEKQQLEEEEMGEGGDGETAFSIESGLEEGVGEESSPSVTFHIPSLGDRVGSSAGGEEEEEEDHHGARFWESLLTQDQGGDEEEGNKNRGSEAVAVVKETEEGREAETFRPADLGGGEDGGEKSADTEVGEEEATSTLADEQTSAPVRSPPGDSREPKSMSPPPPPKPSVASPPPPAAAAPVAPISVLRVVQDPLRRGSPHVIIRLRGKGVGEESSAEVQRDPAEKEEEEEDKVVRPKEAAEEQVQKEKEPDMTLAEQEEEEEEETEEDLYKEYNITQQYHDTPER